MIVFPVHVVPTEELGRIFSNLQTILIFFFFFNNLRYLFRNLTCNYKNHQSCQDGSIFDRSPSNETAYLPNYFVHVDVSNKG